MITVDSLEINLKKVRQFCEDRDWDQFHNPKDLAIGLSTEANELLDLFRFKTETDMATMLQNDTTRNKISHELADILFFLLRFAQRFDFDLLDALEQKLAVNSEKYPVHQVRGSNRKYNES